MMLHEFTELTELLKLDFPELNFSIAIKKCSFWSDGKNWPNLSTKFSENVCLLENGTIGTQHICECKGIHTQLNLVIEIPNNYYYNDKRILYSGTNIKLSEIPNLNKEEYQLDDEFMKLIKKTIFKNYQRLLRDSKLKSIL